jgi:hypothetical protein
MLAEVILTEAEPKELYADTKRDAMRRTLESSGLLIERSKRIPPRKKTLILSGNYRYSAN